MPPWDRVKNSKFYQIQILHPNLHEHVCAVLFFLKKKTADFCDIDRAPRKRSRVHGMWNHKVCYYNRAKGNIIINVVEPGYRKLFVLHIIKLWGQKGPIPQFTLYFVLPGK